MQQNKSYTNNYTGLGGSYQLVLPLNLDVLIPGDDSVRLLSHILEGLNYEALYKAYSSTGRKPAVEPKILFKILTYSYMRNIYSSRMIEQKCKRDINFMWLLEGRKAPDHSTIARFRKDYLSEAIDGLFFQMVLLYSGISLRSTPDRGLTLTQWGAIQKISPRCIKVQLKLNSIFLRFVYNNREPTSFESFGSLAI